MLKERTSLINDTYCSRTPLLPISQPPCHCFEYPKPALCFQYPKPKPPSQAFRFIPSVVASNIPSSRFIPAPNYPMSWLSISQVVLEKQCLWNFANLDLKNTNNCSIVSLRIWYHWTLTAISPRSGLRPVSQSCYRYLLVNGHIHWSMMHSQFVIAVMFDNKFLYMFEWALVVSNRESINSAASYWCFGIFCEKGYQMMASGLWRFDYYIESNQLPSTGVLISFAINAIKWWPLGSDSSRFDSITIV